MFKWDHKAKTQQSIDQTNLEYELTSFLTHFIYQLGKIKEMIKRESENKMIHIQMMIHELKSIYYTKSRHHLIWKCLGFVPLFQDQHF